MDVGYASWLRARGCSA